MHVTFNPHVSGSGDGKHEQEEDEDEGLQVVCCDSLHTKQDGPEQFALETQCKNIHKQNQLLNDEELES